jgi:hypothetical protein
MDIDRDHIDDAILELLFLGRHDGMRPGNLTGSADVRREGAPWRTLGSRNQVRWLPVQVHLRDAAVKVFTRRGNDWSNRFRKIAGA